MNLTSSEPLPIARSAAGIGVLPKMANRHGLIAGGDHPKVVERVATIACGAPRLDLRRQAAVADTTKEGDTRQAIASRLCYA